MTRTLQYTLIHLLAVTVVLAFVLALTSVTHAQESETDKQRITVSIQPPTVAADAGKLAPRPSRQDNSARFQITPESIQKVISGDSDTVQVTLPDGRQLEVPARLMDKRSDEDSSLQRGGKLQDR